MNALILNPVGSLIASLDFCTSRAIHGELESGTTGIKLK